MAWNSRPLYIGIINYTNYGSDRDLRDIVPKSECSAARGH